MLIHTIAFNKNIWSCNEARKWLNDHNEKAIKPVHKTANYLRYRLFPPEMFKSFVTKSYPNKGINIIFGIE